MLSLVRHDDCPGPYAFDTEAALLDEAVGAAACEIRIQALYDAADVAPEIRR